MNGARGVLVIGGTGAMGSRVVERLVRTTDVPVVVLTRSVDSTRAQRVVSLDRERVTLRPGDLDDTAGLRSIMRDVEWVFCNTDFFATGSVPGEIAQGISALNAARDAGVDRFVYSSLDSAGSLTGGRTPVPHWDAKAAVAEWVTAHRADETMRRIDDGWFTDHVSVLTTAPYFENLLTRLAPSSTTLPDGRRGLVFTLPLGEGRYPVIGLQDIAWFAVHMLQSWQSWGARDLAVVADSLTGHEIARTVEDVTGTPSAYADLPLDELERSTSSVGHDYAAMAQFFRQYDLFAAGRDIGHLRSIHPGLHDFRQWLTALGTDVFGE